MAVLSIDTKDAEGKAEIKSSQDEHQEDDELLANCENQDGKVLMESSEQEENDTEIDNKKEIQGHEEEHAELGEQIQVSERSDDAGLPDPKDDDEKQSSEIPEKKQTQSHKDAQDAETQNHDSGKDDALQIRAPPEENLQLGSSCSPPPARVPPEDLPECKPPENPELAEVLQMPAGLPEGEPAEKLKTSSQGSPSVSSGELHKDDNGSDPQTTCVHWRQAFRWARKRVLACLGSRGAVRSTRVTPVRKSRPSPVETQPEETLAALSTDPVRWPHL
ncbi:uncharacterized protein LOC117286789 [Fukomys damarensis]|uniref:uncharacterized protein LOC117286789 n=1 Tax=Fukomys damarensis TaxID=885580 RepID=UPI001454E501|nr:uncharacterized protein LOC117286789 [Fukomys damarensis]